MKIYKKPIIILCVLCVLCGKIYPQSQAAEIETLLQSNAVTYAQAARFILDAANQFTTTNQNEAYNYALGQNWLPKNASAETAARLDGVSLLLMNAFEIEGGLFYSLTKAPRYAYRELVYQNIIQGRSAPGIKVSGEYLIFMINRVLSEHDREIAIAEARREREARQRRETLAREITVMLEEHQVADTTVEATSAGVTITLSNIQFMADSAQLYPVEVAKIVEISNILKNIPDVKILVTGHTALAGTEEGRIAVSLERAETVAAHLVALGACRQENITAQGYGSQRPVASNQTEEGMALNRRVEITILE